MKSLTTPAGHLLAKTLLLFILFVFCHLVPSAQTGVYTFGDPNVNEGGRVLLNDPANQRLYIGGYRNDSTLILMVDYNGNLLNEICFKVNTAGGTREFLTDMKFDATQTRIIGCGIVHYTNSTSKGGYAFSMAPGLGALLWTRAFPATQGAISFAPFSIHDSDPNGLEFRLTGVNYPNENGAYMRMSKLTGLPLAGSNRDYNLTLSESFYSSVLVPNNYFFAAGRVSHFIGAASYRPSNVKLDAANGNLLAQRSYLRPITWATATLQAQDIALTGNFDTSQVTVGYGNMVDTSQGNFHAFWTKHDFLGQQTVGYEVRFPASFGWEAGREVMRDVNASAESYIILGEGKRSPVNVNANADELWLMSMTTSGTTNWAYRYGGGNLDYFERQGIESQQQLIPVNAGTAKIAFTATTRSFGQGGLNAPEDILLVMTNGVGQFDAQDQNCIDTIIVPSYTPYLANNPINLVVTTPTILNTNPSPPLFDPNVVQETVCGDTLPGGCWAAIDPDYTKVTVPTTFNLGTSPTGVETWTGKYYIGADVTIDGIVLDLTETDVVFAPCTRVSFINGARLRANNSTFRPCEESDSWEGLYFTPTGAGSSGVVNECIFKNAVDALRLQAGSIPGTSVHYDLRITNNLFMNCLRGVSLPGANGVWLEEGITGNTFSVDDREITWGLTDNNGICSTYRSKAYTGIHATNGIFQGNLSQNDFMNTSDSTATSLTGILWTRCSGRISLNNFTNNRHAVQFAQCTYSSIENNRIELNQLFTSFQTQILAATSQMIWVTGNHVVNSTEAGQYNPLGAAISMENCTSANVKENDIDGFSNGIQLINSSNSAINENQITNANIVGVVVDGGTQDTVSCNEIKMRLRRNNSPLNEGIFYRHTVTNQDPSVKIKGNCVTDATYGVILFNATLTVRRVPRMHNNYLYNYTICGVLSQGFNGSQGSGIGTPAQAGRNTFISNNILGGAVDVNASGQSQTWYGNYGISTVSPGVTLIGSNLYNSVASCGLQIGSVSSTIGTGEVCDVFMSNLDGSNVRLMNGDYSEFDVTTDAPMMAGKAADMVVVLVSEGQTAAAIGLRDYIAGHGAYSEADRAWVDYHLYNALGDASSALAALATWEAQTPGSRDFATVQRIHQNLRLAGSAYPALSQTEIEDLSRIDQARAGQAADDARDLLHAAIGGHPHILKAVPMIDLPEATRALDVVNRNIHLHPNPAQSRVTVDYALAELGTGSELRVHDLTGRQLLERDMDMDATSVELEVGGWRPGIYLVSVLDAHGKTLTAKLQVL